MNKKKEKYQTVIITLSDGRVGSFTGPVLIEAKDDLLVERIQFVEPRSLPEGYVLGIIDEAMNKGVIHD